MQRARAALAAAAALATLASLAPAIPARAAAAPVCGMVVKASIVLDADLVDCQGDGLVIGRSGITVDLNGHAVLGQYPGEEGTGTVGIRVGSHDKVVVRGHGLWESRVEGFDTAVLLDKGADGNRIEGLNLRGGTYGVVLRSADDNRIDDNEIAFAGGEYPEPCVAGAAAGVALIGSDHNKVRRNTAQLGLFGIMLSNSDSNSIEDNEAAPEWSDGNVCHGIALFRSDRNRVKGNTAANNVAGGIWVASTSDDNVVSENYAFQNGDDGIDVDNRHTALADNQAVNNGDIGINAVGGVDDDGGNSATGNFNTIQCRHVHCS